MRIIAGEWRGTALTPLGKGDERAHLRPTPDRVRESVFSMLTSRDAIYSARVLDLFAGTGALAFEALSRGAQQAVLIENGKVAQHLIRANIKKLRISERAQLLSTDATRPGCWGGAPFDLVFLDPPYGMELGARALSAVRGWLCDGALIVWEETAQMPPPPGYQHIDSRRFKGTHITILRAA